MRSGRFRTNSPPVVHETVEGETIIVNLDTGSYYDLNETGGYVLGLLEGGSTIPDLVSATTARYGIDNAVAERVVDELVGKLVEEQLVVPTGERPPETASPPSIVVGDARPYAAPVLNKYTDMQELLLLDPVHEVDQAGWPSRA